MSAFNLDSRVRAAMVSDSLDVIGIGNCVINSTVRALRPGMRTTGIAATIEFEPSGEYNKEDPYGAAIDCLDGLQPGQLAVVATGGRDGLAFWGELFSAAAKGRGGTGMVCDGPKRDAEAIVGFEFNVFGASMHPNDHKGQMRVASSGKSIICAGVQVHPEDAVIADTYGVL